MADRAEDAAGARDGGAAFGARGGGEDMSGLGGRAVGVAGAEIADRPGVARGKRTAARGAAGRGARMRSLGSVPLRQWANKRPKPVAKRLIWFQSRIGNPVPARSRVAMGAMTA